MQTVHDAASLRNVVRAWRAQGLSVGSVLTMGNLHAGHFSLVQQALQRCDRVLATVFVNPTQFGQNEDFGRYPRTLEQDRAGLALHGCHLLFAPTVDVMYPFGTEHTTKVHVPVITDTLEGAHRPGHFDGMSTVVTKLLNLVQADISVFGQKDWQQVLVVRRMVRDLAMPIEILDAPTLRETNGLAMSSRNQYLSPEEHGQAALIYATLQALRDEYRRGGIPADLERAAAAKLVDAGFVPDYVAIRRAMDLTMPGVQETGVIGLIAARLGKTRLIDNLLFDNRDRNAANV